MVYLDAALFHHSVFEVTLTARKSWINLISACQRIYSRLVKPMSHFFALKNFNLRILPHLCLYSFASV